MIKGIYTKKIVVENKEEVHPIIMDILKSRYRDGFKNTSSIDFNENSIRSVEAIICVLSVMLPLTNLAYEEQKKIMSQFKAIQSQLNSDKHISIKLSRGNDD